LREDLEEALCEAFLLPLLCSLCFFPFAATFFVGAGSGGRGCWVKSPVKRRGEGGRAREVREALDFDLDAPTNRVHVGSPNADPVIAVLLPQASEDPITSMEVSSLTRARLRSDKADRLERLAAELRAPWGRAGGGGGFTFGEPAGSCGPEQLLYPYRH